MKKFSLVLPAMLMGCISISPYDPVQYNTTVDIAVFAQHLEKICSVKDNAFALNEVIALSALNLEVSTKYRSYENIQEAAKQIRQYSLELSNAYATGEDVSTGYCVLKAQIIRTSAEHLLATFGRK